MNTPAIQDIPDHFSNDGLQSFKLQALYKSEIPVELIGSLVEVSLRNSLDKEFWKFSSTGEGENRLNVLPDGWVEFPRILAWDIPQTRYTYTLKATDADGFVRTYFTGVWNVGKNSSVTGTDLRGTILYQEKGDKGEQGEKGDMLTPEFSIVDGDLIVNF